MEIEERKAKMTVKKQPQAKKVKRKGKKEIKKGITESSQSPDSGHPYSVAPAVRPDGYHFPARRQKY